MSHIDVHLEVGDTGELLDSVTGTSNVGSCSGLSAVRLDVQVGGQVGERIGFHQSNDFKGWIILQERCDSISVLAVLGKTSIT